MKLQLKEKIYSLRIGHILGAGFGFILMLALFVALLGRLSYDVGQWKQETLQTRSKVERLTLQLELLSIQRTFILNHYLETADEDYLTTYQVQQSTYSEVASQLSSLLTTPAEEQAWQDVIVAENEFERKAQDVLRLYDEAFSGSAQFVWNTEGFATQNKLLQAIDHLSQVQGQTSDNIISQTTEIEEFVVITVSIIILLALVVGAGASWIITHRLVKTITNLVEAVKRIGFDLDYRTKPAGPQEIVFFANAINEMAANLSASREELQRRKERMERELQVASQIQASFFPTDLPQLPGLEFATFWQPAREMGGDFYTFIELTSDRIGIVLGDASGKGAPAAMASTLAVGLLEAYAPLFPKAPELLLTKLNQDLCYHFKSKNMNVACCYAIYDNTTQYFHIANAGCLYPYLRRDHQLQQLEVPGLPLGMSPDFEFLGRSYRLQPGDLLLLGSDGLVEARNEQGELFGFDRVERELLHLPTPINIQGAIRHLFQAASQFSGKNELDDDLTLIMIQVEEK